MPYDVISVGSATVDAFVHTDRSELIKIMSAHGTEDLIAYPSGSKLLVQRLSFEIGGGGTNTAVTFSRMGLKTAYLGKLGRDSNAEHILKLLKKEKIDFVGVQSKGQSAFSVILDSIEKDRTILTYRGLVSELKFSEVDLKKMKTKWFYFSSMMEESFKTLEKLSEYAKKNNIKVAFNPSSYLATQGYPFLKKLLSNTQLLILNREEAGYIVKTNETPEQLKLLQEFVPLVIVTDGKNGADAYNGEYWYHGNTHKSKVVECTGAGDAFASGFLSGVIHNYDLETSMSIGMANSESVISYVGAKEVLLTKTQALNKIRKNPFKITKKKL